MFLNKDRQKFAKAVAFMIGLQGLVWCALSITGIVTYNSHPDKVKQDITTYKRYIDYLSRVIFDDFMVEGRTRVIRPQDFAAFLWIYTILSALWVAVSIDQYAAIVNKNKRQALVTLVLGVLILITSIIDLVFVSLLARDLDTCPFSLVTTTTTTTTTEPPANEDSLSVSQDSFVSLYAGSTSGGTAVDCQLANGIIMTIAARGYVLWAINVVLAISLITIGAKVLRIPALFNYANNTIPRVPEQRKQPSTTGIFLGDDDDVFPPPPSQQNTNRNRSNMPVALTNKNQTAYY